MEEERKDILGGVVLAIVGAALAWHCVESYDLGSLRRMGTGLYPMLAGILLAMLGLAIALPPLVQGIRPGRITLPPLRATVFIVAAVAAFGILVEPFGLFPAIAALVVLADLASSERTCLRDTVLMIAALCALAWIVFGLGMSLGLQMFSWPW